MAESRKKFEMKKIVILWIIFILWNISFACGCLGTSTVKGGLKYSNFVFLGKVIDSEPVSLLPKDYVAYPWLTEEENEPFVKFREIFSKRMKYTFVVSEIFKGNITTDTIAVYSGFGNGDCGYTFHIGNEYIVYATWNKSLKGCDGSILLKFLETHICTRTQPFNINEIKEIESALMEDPNEHTLTLDSNETLQTWLNYYKSFDNDFSLDNFIFESEKIIDEIPGTIYGIFDEHFDQRFAVFLSFSPNKRKYIDLDTYGMSLDEDNKADFEIDQGVNIVDIEEKTIARIFFLGTRERVEDAFWRNDSSLVFLMTQRDYFPIIATFDLNTKEMKYYEYHSILDFNSDYYYERLRKKGVIID